MSDDENRDTSALPPPPQKPSESGEWYAMSDRELMIAILRSQAETTLRLDKIERRLSDSDGDIGVLVGVLRQLCLERGRPDMAARIDEDILALRKSVDSNGTNEDTNPGR